MASVRSLNGLRVLVVEDEMLVSLVIEEVLAEHMCEIVGIDAALAEARSTAIDFALLDVNVGGIMVYPVARILDKRRIPFRFLSGYGSEAIPAEHPNWRVCSKPFQADALVAMMIEELNRISRA